MHNPIRRNRNIGTENQGFSQNNRFRISTPYGTLKSFYERLPFCHKILLVDYPTAILAESFHKYGGIGSLSSHLILIGLLP